MLMRHLISQAAEPLVKVLAAIQSPKWQCINSLISVGLDVLGILGIPVSSSISLIKDSGELLLRILSEKEIDKANVFAMAHNLASLIPVYAQCQSIIAFTIDSAQLANYVSDRIEIKRSTTD